MFGGKLAAKKKQEFSNNDTNNNNNNNDNNMHHKCAPSSKDDYRIQQLLHGGPVQRALNADLILLRLEFRKDLDDYRIASMSNSNSKRKSGAIFKVFKHTFQRTKFGIVHTRVCPPRCDREAYIQQIYSAALDQLKTSFRGYGYGQDGCVCRDEGGDEGEVESVGEGGNLNGDENGHDSNHEIETSWDDTKYTFQLNAIFSIFALYTLYETNPLPEELSSNSHQQYVHQHRHQHQPHQNQPHQQTKEQNIKQILSIIPLGTSTDQSGRSAYRRAYRSLIRIDLNEFSLIQRFRDLALTWMEDCECEHKQDEDEMSASISTDDVGISNDAVNSTSEGVRSKLRLVHGLALDCIHIIDRLQPLFQLAEYSGPASLEGLAGSADYYHAIALGEEVGSDNYIPIKSNSNSNSSITTPTPMHQSREDSDISLDLKHVLKSSRKPLEKGLRDKLELTQFEASMTTYQNQYGNLLGNIAMQLAKNKSASRPSRQLESIELTLKSTLERRTGAGGNRSVRSIGIIDQIRKAVSSDLPKTGAQPISRGEQSNVVASSDQLRTERSVATDVSIEFPVSFSSDLKFKIEKVVRTILEEKKKAETESLRKRAIVRGRSEICDDGNVNDWFFDEFVGSENEHEYEHEHEGGWGDESIDRTDDFSVEDTGQMEGLGALQQLLSSVRVGQNKKRQKTVKRKQHNKGRSKKTSLQSAQDSNESDDSGASDSDSDSDSDNSFESGPGNRALQTLLTSVTNGEHAKRKRRSKVNPKKRAGLSASDGKSSTNSIKSDKTFTDSTTVAGTGQTALLKLINQAKHPPKKKRKSAPKAKHVKSKSTKLSLLGDDGESFHRSRSIGTRTRSSRRRGVNVNMDDNKSILSLNSLSTFGAGSTVDKGRTALQSLLTKAAAQTCNSIHSKASASACTEPITGSQNAQNDNDDDSAFGDASIQESLATAGPGRNALDKLLSKIK